MNPSPFTESELQKFRQDTPGCEKAVHLNNAGAALMPECVVTAVERYLRLELEKGGYETAEETEEDNRHLYESLAELLGAKARNIALLDSATSAYAAALSALEFKVEDVILTTQDDYISNQIQFLSLVERFGVKIVRVPSTPEGELDLESMVRLMRAHQPKLVAVTHIPTNSGLVQPVEKVGALCKEYGYMYLVDGCQSLGQLPLNMREIGADFFSSTGRKFLRGPRGTGLLYVSDRALERGCKPLFIDMRGAKWVAPNVYQPVTDAKRFENWEFPYALLAGLGEATRYALKVGPERIQARNKGLCDVLREGLRRIDGLRILDRGSVQASIVTVHVPGWQPEKLKLALSRKGFNTSLVMQDVALIDFQQKGAEWALRLSPHYYNTEDELRSFCDYLGWLMSHQMRH